MSDLKGNGKTKTNISQVFSIDFADDSVPMPGVTQLLNPQAIREKAAKAEAKAAELKDQKTTIREYTNASAIRQAPTQSYTGHTHAQAPALAPPKVAKQKELPKEIEIEFDPTHDPDLEPSRVEIRSGNSSTTQALDLAKMGGVKNVHRADTLTLAELGVQFELHFEMERGQFRYHKMKGHLRERFAMWQEKFYFQMKLDFKTLEVHGAFQEFGKNTHPFQEEAFGLTDASFVQIVRFPENPKKVFVLISEHSLVTHEKRVREILSGVAHKTDDGDGDGSDFKIELVS